MGLFGRNIIVSQGESVIAHKQVAKYKVQAIQMVVVWRKSIFKC